MSIEIKRVEIKNFKKVLNKNIDFTGGLNTIHGPNFSGKTTIIQSILYCLYGSSSVDGNADSLPNSGTKSKPHVLVHMSNDLVVERNGGSVTLSKGGEPVARSATIVSNSLVDYIGLSKDQLLKTRISQQGEAQVLLSTGNSELKKLVEGLAGYDRIDKVLKLAKSKKKISKERVSTLREVYIGDSSVKSLQKSIQDNAKKLEGLIKSSKQVSKDREKTEQVLNLEKEELKQVLKQNSKAERSIALAESAENRLKKLNQELSELEVPTSSVPLTEIEGSIEELSKDLSVKEGLILEHRDNHSKLEKAKSNLKSAKLSLEQDVEELSNLGDCVRTQDQIEQEIESVSNEVSDFKKTIDLNTNILEGVECSACGRPFDEHQNVDKESLNNGILKCKQKMQEADLRLKELKKELPKNIRDNTLRSRLKEDILQGEQKVKNLEEVISSIDIGLSLEQVEEINSQVESITKQLKALYSDKSKASKYFTQKKLIAKSIKEAEYELTEHKGKCKDIVDTKPLEDSVEHNISKLDDLVSKAIQMEGTTKQLQSQIEVDKENLESQNSLKLKIFEAKKKLEVLTNLDKIISKNRGSIMSNIWSGIMHEATDFVSSVTEGYVSRVFVDDNFQVCYKEHDKVYPISSASGSQKSLISLGIRIGIGNLLPSKAGFFIMDEITADMEEEISMLAMSVAKQKCGQIIAISHREADMTASDNLIPTVR